MSVLDDEAEDLEGDLDASKELVGDQLGPLEGEELDGVLDHLKNAQSHITTIQTIIGSGTGAADTGNNPSGLPACAAECLTLANAIEEQTNRPSPDYTIIGNCAKTITRIIDLPSTGYIALAENGPQ